MNFRCCCRPLGWALSMLLFVGTAPADDQETAPKVDPQADKVLRAASDYLKQARTFRLEARSVVKRQHREGALLEAHSSAKIVVERPNKLSLIAEDGPVKLDGKPAPKLRRQCATWSLICDGEKLCAYPPFGDEIISRPSPERLESVAESAALPTQVNLSSALFVQLLLQSDLHQTLTKNATEISYEGLSELDGVKCHRIRHLKVVPVFLWIQADGPPLVRRVTMGPTPGQEARGGDAGIEVGPTPEITESYSNWQFDVELAADAFRQLAIGAPSPKPTPIAGGESDRKTPAHELVGTRAATEPLEMLDGGTFDLTRHKGKQVVILDFWAMWCVPCCQEMPHLIELAEANKDRGVVLYAVNLAENPEAVRKFVKKMKWDCTVPLDQKRALAKHYKVGPIPQTMIIDKDGVVRFVQVGALQDIKQVLQRELDGLLAPP